MKAHAIVADAPGLKSRPRAEGYALYWVASLKDHKPATVLLWPPKGEPWREPGPEDVITIRSRCSELQTTMLGQKPKRPARDTIAWLIEAYKTDRDSPYRALRHATRITYDKHMEKIAKNVGAVPLSQVKGRDFKRWHQGWMVSKDGSRHVSRASARMTMVRGLMSFGAGILEHPQCVRLHAVLSTMRFETPRPRTMATTVAQAVALREAAHRIGLPMIALSEALRFELGLRVTDVIGQWIPIRDPGMSDVISRSGAMKWLLGLDWREIDEHWILTHRLSKSLRGREALADQSAGKVLRWDLKLYPMVMEELAANLLGHSSGESGKISHVHNAIAERIHNKRTGPLIIDRSTGLPYLLIDHLRDWQKARDAAGLPKGLQPRDSRAGSITDGLLAGASLEAVRQTVGHADVRTTMRYSRDDVQHRADVIKLRVEKRGKE